MKTLFFSIFISLSALAQICEDDGQLGTLSQFAGRECFSSEITKDDVGYEVVSKDQVENFCKKCESPAYKKILEHKEAVEEKETAYGKAILDEVQKELSFITMDLMKMRMSFGMNISSKDAVSSCNFKKQLKKPDCLTKDQEKAYDEQIGQIQNSLATELADILSNKKSITGGLFIKRNPTCDIQDKNAMFAYMRYLEDLITPNLLADIQKQNLSNSKFDSNKLSPKNETDLLLLNGHPLFSSLLSSPGELKNFVDQAMKVSADKKYPHNKEAITELLYDSTSQGFSKNIKDKCQSIFSKATDHLKNNFCNDKKAYVADDLESLEAVSGVQFFNMDESKAKKEMNTHCALVNNKKPDSISFSVVKKDLHSMTNDSFVKFPITEFKSNVYSRMFLNVANNICAAIGKDSPCKKDPKQAICTIAKYYFESKENTQSKELASQSDDNINQILQALVGDGLPQKDGKVDQVAVTLLQKERILPGGASNEPAPKKATASEFHKTVRSSGGNSPLPSTANTAKVAPEFKQGDQTQNSAPQMHSNMNFNSNRDDTESESNSASPAMKKASKKLGQNDFSALSDAEQQDLLNRLKKGAKKKSHNVAEDESEDESSFGEAKQQDNDGSFSAAAEGASVADNTRVAGQRFNDDRFAGKKATIDPVKKVSSVNNALIDANKNRSPATSGGTASSPVVSISKPSKNENEIQIQVDDKELSRVTEFKNKLKELLAAHNQELSVVEVGEKIVVKLNNHSIDVVYNKEKGFYEATTNDKEIPKDYLNTISYYFNVTLKEGKGKREALVKTMQNSKK